MGNCPTKKYMPAVTSTPIVNENETSINKSGFEAEDSSVGDNEVCCYVDIKFYCKNGNKFKCVFKQ